MRGDEKPAVDSVDSMPPHMKVNHASSTQSKQGDHLPNKPLQEQIAYWGAVSFVLVQCRILLATPLQQPWKWNLLMLVEAKSTCFSSKMSEDFSWNTHGIHGPHGPKPASLQALSPAAACSTSSAQTSPHLPGR